jgi:hypothetical protein
MSNQDIPMRFAALEAAIALMVLAVWAPVFADEFAVELPDGVRAVWDLDKAYREATPTRERICLNGLWRWRPARGEGAAEPVPGAGWGYFKVPGCWPGITDYMQKDGQTVFSHPLWGKTPLRSLTAAWYEREVRVPETWDGRRIVLSLDVLNSLATVHVDGARAGALRFPGGELDLTGFLRPGGAHRLSLHVEALPLKGVMLSYSDTASARQVRGTVARRGLCGDVFLVGTPAAARLAEVAVTTSVRRRQIAVDAELQQLEAGRSYSLRARISEAGRVVREFTSPAFTVGDLKDGRLRFSENWQPERLWDLHTPGNQLLLSLSLLDGADRVLDTAFEERFGFRELWIDGRDFHLNGSRIFLSAVPLDNAQVGAAWAGYEGARESLERLKSFGINFVYTHNYGCEPGTHLGFGEILRAADDVGMLVSFSQPHFGQYDWKAPDADANNGYARHASYYVGIARNHPSVVFYSMSHNATGYSEDMNPDLIDGVHDPRDTWALRNAQLARRAEGIVSRLDPSRIVYHHSSGNLGSMHTSNFYPNFVPIQELSDWFEHWATEGVKPVFTCEYGAPFTWDWAMYRGWYQGRREFGSARVPWEFCHAEWNAQFLGDRAYRLTDREQANLRWEARQFREGRLWHRWDYPTDLGSRLFEDRQTVIARYLTDNWRAFRAWGVSAISPWEYGHYWIPRDDVEKGRKTLPVDWDALQRPGFSPDYVEDRYERMDLAYERSDWIPTAAGQALIRNNRPLLAYLGGKPARFTSRDHNVWPGETVEKQIVIVNNSRETVACDGSWSFGPAVRGAGGEADRGEDLASGRKTVSVPTGRVERIAVAWELPPAQPPGTYELRLTARFSTGETQEDAFSIHVLPAPGNQPAAPSMGGGSLNRPEEASARVALFDPIGETRARLEAIGVRFQSVGADADLSAFDVLIVGKSALTLDGPAPDIRRVRDGLKVLVFEQSSPVLERRLGFRVVEYGLRQVFPRVPGHPALAGLEAEHLQDWRGEATLLPPRLRYESRPMHGPTVTWCDIPVTRAWRCGNRGNVASVLIEKPARGDFLPILDGGHSLQYSPLLEHRQGRGMVLFCQLDVTGRTENDPAAEALARNLIRHVVTWRPSENRRVVYAGNPAGLRFLQAAGVPVSEYPGKEPPLDTVLVVGPGGGDVLKGQGPAIARWLKAGGRALAIGADEADANAFLPAAVRMKPAEHIAADFEPGRADSWRAGVGPADVHNRDPRRLPLLTAGAGAGAGVSVVGNGVLGRIGVEDGDVVFCQLAPWTFDPGGTLNLKRTFRRTAFLVARLLANRGVHSPTPVLDRFATPVTQEPAERRWLEGLYLDQPEEWDDPYRFFRW